MKREKTVRVLTYLYLLPFLAVVIFNTINSLLRTGYFETGQYVEIIRYRRNHMLLTLILAAVMFSGLMPVQKSNVSVKEKAKKISVIWAVALCLTSILLFRAVAKCDSEFLSEAAIQFMQGNYAAFQTGEYFYMYPFQLGYTAFIELIYRAFGIENYIVFQLINTVCIMDMICILGDITWDLFADEKIYSIEMYLSMGMLPLFLLSTFVYGDIPGWCLGVHAILNAIRYLKEEKGKYIFKASIWLAFAVTAKSNMNILMLAIVIALLLQALMRRKPKVLMWIVEIVILSQLGMALINCVYSFRMGEQIPQGIPKVAWIAMGFQEPYEDGSAAGWYNGYNWSVYVESSYDASKASQICVEDLKNSWKGFMKSPGHAVRYFYDKFTSQWNEPTFMALLTNEWYSRNEYPQSDLAIFFLYGRGRDILYEIMKAFHFLMFFLTAAGCIMICRKWKIERAYFVLNIFGGMLFHMLWEAKTRYVLGYFVLMLPVAAYGGLELARRLSGLFSKNRREQLEGERS